MKLERIVYMLDSSLGTEARTIFGIARLSIFSHRLYYVYNYGFRLQHLAYTYSKTVKFNCSLRHSLFFHAL
jgi:hypothetical protein